MNYQLIDEAKPQYYGWGWKNPFRLAVLAHELTHVYQHDTIYNFVQKYQEEAFLYCGDPSSCSQSAKEHGYSLNKYEVEARVAGDIIEDIARAHPPGEK